MSPHTLCLGRFVLVTSCICGCIPGGTDPSTPAALHNRLVFQAADMGRIGVMAPDGSQRRLLSATGNQFLALDPAVSPDGRLIAFSGLRSGQWDLYVMDAAGEHRRQLTNDSAQDVHPRWSPDGASLLFTASAPSTVTLVTINADGSNRRDFLSDAWGGDWSPDGTQIAFTGIGARPRGVYITDAAGTHVTSLLDVCGPDCVDIAPRWSPDGRLLAFTRLVPGNIVEAVGIMQADGTGAALVLPGVSSFGPVWSPDGRSLALTLRFGRIYLLTLATGDTVAVSPSPAWDIVTDWVR